MMCSPTWSSRVKITFSNIFFVPGEFLSETGETVIDEEEFGLIKRLQDLKTRYRDDFEKWRELKSEIVYCQNLVEQCRQRLIQEFDTWYNETYFGNIQLPKGSDQSMDKFEPKYGSAAARQYVRYSLYIWLFCWFMGCYGLTTESKNDLLCNFNFRSRIMKT